MSSTRTGNLRTVGPLGLPSHESQVAFDGRPEGDAPDIFQPVGQPHRTRNPERMAKTMPSVGKLARFDRGPQMPAYLDRPRRRTLLQRLQRRLAR